MLYLTGWIFYADTSINVSLSQNGATEDRRARPRDPRRPRRMEDRDPRDGLSGGEDEDHAGRSLGRCSTARTRACASARTSRSSGTASSTRSTSRGSRCGSTPLPLVSAELVVPRLLPDDAGDAEAPHLFVHDDVSTEPRWADMAGLYTRFGDVRPLLTAADDRYVVMKGGDAVRLEFDASALPPLPGRMDARLPDRARRLGKGRRQEHRGRARRSSRCRSTAWTTRATESSTSRTARSIGEFVREYLTRRGGPEEFGTRCKESRESGVEESGSEARRAASGRGGSAASGSREPPATGVFRDVTKDSGRLACGSSSDLRRLKLIATMVGGCAMGDYDDDGRPDLYVTNSIPHWGKPNRDHCGRLYRNVGGRFEDVTAKSGVRACGLGMGAFWADLDGDGRLDLYLTNVGPNAVWWNRGDGTFEEGRDTGLEDPLFSVGAAFLDFDGDGRLDVAVGNYLDSTPGVGGRAGSSSSCACRRTTSGQPSRLYRNLGGRKFAT